jgi:hypothetical protein
MKKKSILLSIFFGVLVRTAPAQRNVIVAAEGKDKLEQSNPDQFQQYNQFQRKIVQKYLVVEYLRLIVNDISNIVTNTY